MHIVTWDVPFNFLILIVRTSTKFISAIKTKMYFKVKNNYICQKKNKKKQKKTVYSSIFCKKKKRLLGNLVSHQKVTCKFI